MSLERKKTFRPTPESKAQEPHSHSTSKELQLIGNKSIEFFTKRFTIDGEENIDEVKALQSKNPESRFIIASSHLSNLDVPAAIKAIGNTFNLQISATSQNFGLTQQEIMFRLGGKENFSPLTHTKKTSTEASRGVFNPEDFSDLIKKTQEGKSVWIAAHEFTVEEKMQRAKIGSVYLAQKTGAYVLPTALELQGGASVSLEKPTDVVKGAFKKANAIYHVGKLIKLEPIDVSVIDHVFEKRKRSEDISIEERKKFSATITLLRQQAQQLSVTIASLLPENMRGVYETNTLNEEVS